MGEQPEQRQVPGEFSDNLDHWGTDLNHWPPAAAQRARVLMASSTEARAQFAAAEKLQALLHALPALAAPVTLKAHIASNAPTDSWDQLSQWLRASLWRPVLAGGLPLVVGFMLGFTLTINPTINPDDEMADQISLISLTTSFEEFDDDL